MSTVIAKKYANILMNIESADHDEILTSLSAFSLLFTNKKIKERILSPIISNSDKESMLLGSEVSNQHVSNLIKLLIEKDGLELIPLIAEEVRLATAIKKSSFEGIIFSNSEVDSSTVAQITEFIKTKVNADVSFTQVKTEDVGFKIEVADLGLELSFSHQAMKQQLINHILKAI
jgi:F0F1-type ATP synthase delta subunit